MNHALAFSAVLTLLAVTSPLAAQQIAPATTSLYISPTGDDNSDGSADHPIRTVQHARDMVRGMNRAMTSDLTVYLHGGVYRLSQPLSLESSDSGMNGHTVTYSAVPGEQPIIIGALAVTGWHKVDAARNLWSAPAPPGLNNTRQLYVNGRRAQRSRGRLPVVLSMTSTGYTADSPLMAGWRNPTDIEFVYTGGNSIWSEESVGLGGWTEPRCPVASIQGTTITMAQPCWDNSTRRVMLPKSSGFKRTANLVGPASVGKRPAFVENAFELLGTPGQWYFDRPARRLYYVPRAGEDLASADVEAPVLESLLTGQGTAASPIHDITFSGIQFSYATWLMPGGGDGFSEIQANYMVTGQGGYATQGLCALAPGGTCPYGAWTPEPANVSFNYDKHLTFLNDDFVHLGAAGLSLGDGSQFDTVEGCVFTDISGNSLDLGGVDLPLATGAQATRDNQILNNHIYSSAVEYRGGVGICVGYAQRTNIRHNQIDHMPYTGISLGWGGWPDKIHQAGQANTSGGNVAANNLIFDHLLVLADGAGIYTQGLTGPSLAQGEKLIGNVIHDQFSSGHALYTDNGCKNVTAAGNVLFRTNHDNWGGRHKDYYDGHLGQDYDAFDGENNYWQQGDADISGRDVTLKNNHLISALNQVPDTILSDAGPEPFFKTILNRKFSPPGAPDSPSRVAAALANGSAYVSWSPPICDGGASIQSYTLTSSTGVRAAISASDFRALGYAVLLHAVSPNAPAGAPITFTVTAANNYGDSPPSLPSLPVSLSGRPIRKPDVPAKATALPGDGAASIHFQPPASTGGGPILAYRVTVNPGGRTVTVTGRKIVTLSGRHATFVVVDGLQNGKPYTFDVAAVSSAGAGPPRRTKSIVPSAHP